LCRVRGTVRSIKNEEKVAHLRNMCPGAEGRLELVEADLNAEKGWAEAVQGCTFIM
jgi:dihydroflavonol-4-reductase